MRGLWIVLLIAGGCGDDDAPGDGGTSADRTEPRDVPVSGPCTTPEDCDDGVVCNGEETCSSGECVAGTAVDCADEDPCTDDACDEATGTCTHAPPDADGDGHTRSDCGGDDCDDDDALAFPGNPEVCDTHDDDCDDTTFGTTDGDGDDHVSNVCCNGTTCGDDCDDTRAGVHPLEAESCDGLDNDCDGMVDDGVLITWYVDADRDGHGSDEPDAATEMACSQPMGFSPTNDDCDDTEGGINPGVPDACDLARVDDDCDGVPNDGCDCDDGAMRSCDDVIFDARGDALYGVCASGVRTCIGGVYDACSITPGTEDCDMVAPRQDEDCDGMIDEGVVADVTCYPDTDGDGYTAPPSAPRRFRCADPSRTAVGGCPPMFTNRSADVVADQDCAPNNPNVYPGAPFPAGSRPACDHPSYVPCLVPGSAVTWACIPPTDACVAGVTSLAPVVFDWNCSAGSMLVPALACMGAATVCVSSTECGGNGFAYDTGAPPACGTPVPFARCACDTAMFSCGGVTLGTSYPIPCR